MPAIEPQPAHSVPAQSTASSKARWMALIAAFLGWMFDGMEMGIFPLVARPALQEMQVNSGIVDDKFISHWMGWITAWFLWGAALGGIVFGWLGDRIGRVRAMTLSILCYSLFTGLSYFATQPWHLGVFRFIAALGMGGEWSLGVALVMECWPAKHRPLLAGAIGAAANVGFALIAVFGIVFPITPTSWRWVMLIGAAPALLTFFIRLFVPESERWKESVKDGHAQPLREIFGGGLLKTTLLAIAFASISLIVTWGAVQWIAAWADQMAGKELPKAKAYAQLSSALGAIIGCLAGAWVGGRFGRRPAYFLLCLLSLIFGTWLFRGMNEFNAQFLALVFLVGGFTAAFYGWLPLYLPELFPTRVRATAQGLSFNFGRILAGIGALQMGALVQNLGGNYAKAGATIILIYILGLVLIWLAPETKGRPLPE
jgi:MFS transporter, SHS family, sialic acid transporter